MKVLAGDIGGTNSRFLIAEVGEGRYSVRFSRSLPSADYATFQAALDAFLDSAGGESRGLTSACFAMAGPVEGTIGRVTNLPWVLESQKLSDRLSGLPVRLINDFEAIGWGLEVLAPKQIHALQEGSPLAGAPRALIGAGTGLGQALLLPCGDLYRIQATEGGHVDFAPQDEIQVALLSYLLKRYDHVSYERLVSGAGLAVLLDFLQEYRGQRPGEALLQSLAAGDPAAVISNFGLKGGELLACEALDLFIAIYGAQAGNLALTCLPRGGLYVAGGIAPKILARMGEGGFLRAFLHKGRMRGLLEKIPVRVVLDEHIGLQGAAMAAWHFGEESIPGG
ncbi:MAG: glucokinase [Gammaproteobacteria bacterium]|nr:glucokinase [Gammaproteobacteria bacterium]MBU1655495.1 glucokinase [Gammaproteobacteria bacterium]MBU1961696.1 glucokinase [Gammaproteobacteria bacterium]